MNLYLTEGKESSVLIKYTLPLLGSMLFQQLYNIADSLVAGKFIGDNALAAVGNSYEITLIFIAFATGSSVGASVVISQLFGGKRNQEMKTAISTTFIYAIVLAFTLTVLGRIFSNPLLRLINTPDGLMADSALYLDIYIYGLIFLFLYNIATGVFTAMGDSRTPFLFLAFSSTANIAIDILFVTAFGMGVDGVAWATFLCQGISSILACATLFFRLRTIESGVKAPLFSFHLLKKVLRIAIPSILQQSFVSIGNIFVQSVINSFGAVVMAGYAAAIKLNNLVITSLTTMSNGVSSFTAQNFGAGKIDRVDKGKSVSIAIGYAFAIPAFLLYFFLGRYILLLFMNDIEGDALKVGMQFLRIVSPFYFVITLKIMSDGILRGAGAMNAFMISTFSDLLLRAGLSFVFSRFWGAIGIWLSWPVGWAVGTTISLMFLFSGKWKNLSLV